MRLVVMKFGGTSVSTQEARRQAMGHVRRELEQGNQPVVVISAMGRKGAPYATDRQGRGPGLPGPAHQLRGDHLRLRVCR